MTLRFRLARQQVLLLGLVSHCPVLFIWLVCVAWLGALGLQSLAYAQGQAAILTGKVTDTTGAVIAGVKITATNQQTGIVQTVQSNQTGNFHLPFLPLGTYVVTAENEGFKKVSTTSISLEGNQTARVDFTLEPGNLTELVTVELSPLLQTETVAVQQTISRHALVSLPTNGRNFQQLTLLAAGVVTPAPQSFTSLLPGNFEGQPYVNGNREQTNSFLLDGITVSETIANRLGYKPNLDALAEFTIQTSNPAAEFGNVAGAVVSTTLKSGTNNFNGNLFEFLRNDALDANSWGNNRSGAPKRTLRQNIFGGTLGGPLVRNRLFFFTDFQGIQRRTGGGATATLAPAEWRRGDLSSLTFPVIDPLTKKPFPGNVIPVNRIVNPAALALFKDPGLYPSATRPGARNFAGNFVGTVAETLIANQFDTRVDGHVTSHDAVALRYSFVDSTNDGSKGLVPAILTGAFRGRTHNVLLGWTHVVNPNIVNEFRFGLNRSRFYEGPNDWAGLGKANARLGIPGNQVVPGLSLLVVGDGVNNIGSVGVVGDGTTNTFSYSDTMTVAYRRHFFKFGGQVLRYQENQFFSGNAGVLGVYVYTGAFSGSGFADFLLDRVTVKAIGSLTGDWGQRQIRYALFAQDDYRIRNGLTVNLGLRWEYTTPLVEVLDRQSNFDLTTGRQLFAGRDGNSRGLYDSYFKGFEPRIGLALNPTLLRRALVVRMGYGITQFMEGTGANLRLPQNPPFFAESSVVFDQTTGPGTIRTGFTEVIRQDKVAGLIRVWNPKLRPQFTQQWNLSVEYRLDANTSITAAYVGHRATHLVAPTDFNQPVPGTGPPETWIPAQQRRPLFKALPLVTSTSGTDSWARSNYHSLQISLRHRLSRGLEVIGAYTFSKALSDNIGYFGSNAVALNGFYPSNAYNRRADYGPSYFDATHNQTTALTYDLPVGKNHRLGSHWAAPSQILLGNWAIGTILSFRSGVPITVVSNGVSLQSPHPASAGHPNRIGNGRPSHQTIDKWIDPSAFVQPQLGTFGNAGAGILRAPGYANWDFSVSKKIPVSETKSLEFRVEFFNFTNHVNFGPPASNFSSPTTFGKITSTVGTPRNLEFALKFYF